MNNLDVFNIASLEIFHCCLDTFPLPTELITVDLAVNISGYFESPKNDESYQSHFDNLDDTIHETISWLKHEGFLVDKGSSMDSYAVVLSQKGLNAVNSVPRFLESKKSFKDYFSSGLSNLPFNIASGVMVEFFKTGT
jgi:hypothetical protein